LPQAHEQVLSHAPTRENSQKSGNESGSYDTIKSGHPERSEQSLPTSSESSRSSSYASSLDLLHSAVDPSELSTALLDKQIASGRNPEEVVLDNGFSQLLRMRVMAASAAASGKALPPFPFAYSLPKPPSPASQSWLKKASWQFAQMSPSESDFVSSESSYVDAR